MSADVLIELKGVDVLRLDEQGRLLRGVNWRISRDEFWVVGGGPGSGKTSLLSTAASLHRPGAGQFCIFGRDLAEATEAEQVEWRRRIGYVFENGGHLFSQLTVGANIALPLEYHADVDAAQARQRVEYWLKRTELAPYEHVMPSRLALRLQQRASLARALAEKTEILFLDNPLSGLGWRDTRWWIEFLRDQRALQEKAGTPLTVVTTCDDFRPWLEVANRFGVIRGEQFQVFVGREDLLASGDAAVRELVGEALN